MDQSGGWGREGRETRRVGVFKTFVITSRVTKRCLEDSESSPRGGSFESGCGGGYGSTQSVEINMNGG